MNKKIKQSQKEQDNNDIKSEETMLKKMVNFKMKEANQEQYIIYGVFSTDNEDWHGEKVDQNGWDLSIFNTNPVILFAHDHYQPAVAQGVDIKVQDEGTFLTGTPNGKMVLAGGIKFAAEEYPFAMTLFKLYSGKFMRAFSAGFYNKQSEYDATDDTVVLLINVLLEISCCNIPANAMALAKSKGIDTSSIKDVLQKNNDEMLDNIEKRLLEKIEIPMVSKIQETVKSILRADIEKKQEKVETPVNQGRIQKGVYSPREVNKTIRQLLKAKSLMDRK